MPSRNALRRADTSRRYCGERPVPAQEDPSLRLVFGGPETQLPVCLLSREEKGHGESPLLRAWPTQTPFLEVLASKGKSRSSPGSTLCSLTLLLPREKVRFACY